MMREAQVERVTAETKVKLSLNLDGSGAFEGKTGVGFLDHMLHLLARHSLIDLSVDAVGDLYVDAHHTVEDTGICLGMALQKALGDKKGINRYGSAMIPMDEALAIVALDLSGRPFLSYAVKAPGQVAGDLPVELVPGVFQSYNK